MVIDEWNITQLLEQIAAQEAELEFLHNSIDPHPGDINRAEAELHVARRELGKRNKMSA